MKEEKKKISTVGRGITDYNGQVFHYFLSGAILETLAWFLGIYQSPKKVASTVATFFK